MKISIIHCNYNYINKEPLGSIAGAYSDCCLKNFQVY